MINAFKAIDLSVIKYFPTYRQYFMNRMKIFHKNSNNADIFIYSFLNQVFIVKVLDRIYGYISSHKKTKWIFSPDLHRLPCKQYLLINVNIN